jgi:hypothetical protein
MPWERTKHAVRLDMRDPEVRRAVDERYARWSPRESAAEKQIELPAPAGQADVHAPSHLQPKRRVRAKFRRREGTYAPRGRSEPSADFQDCTSPPFMGERRAITHIDHRPPS